MKQILRNKDVDGLAISVTQETDDSVLIVIKQDTHCVSRAKIGDWMVHRLEVKEQRSLIRYRRHK